MIVEDDLAYGRLQELRLQDSPTTRFTGTVVRNLKDALDQLDGDPADAVLLDLGLPDAQGVEAVKAVHAAHPTVPIVVMTGTVDDEIMRAAKEAGAADVTEKGADTNETLELRILAAAYRQAYGRLASSDPLAPATRALVADIGLHLRMAENLVRGLRARLGAGEVLPPDFLDRSLALVQEALAPMELNPSEDLLLRPLRLKPLVERAAEHQVEIEIFGDDVWVLGQRPSVQRALGSLMPIFFENASTLQIELERAGDLVTVHLATPQAPTTKRRHPLLWTMATDLLALSMATLSADDTGFTIRFAAAQPSAVTPGIVPPPPSRRRAA